MTTSLKFGRNYELHVELNNGETIVVKLPFTIEFDITRNTLTSANVCQVRIYNLSPQNRNQIRKNVTNYGFPMQSILLRGGYGNNLATIFSGTISQAWSVREGTNFITQIECYDGGFAFVNNTTSIPTPPLQAGISNRDAIIILINTLKPYGVTLGQVGNFPGTISRGNSYAGDVIDTIRTLTGGGFFIDNGVANALGTTETLVSAPLIINSDTGLLNTPILEQYIARFEMLFEPNLQVGASIVLKSSTEGNFNGVYKVLSVKHRGMISAAVAGSATTTGTFYLIQPPRL